MVCRLCGCTLTPSSTELGRTATSLSDCFYQCAGCRVGYSNSQFPDERTLIFDRWERNIPPEAHSELIACIDRSLNEKSRPTKLARLAFESSEDAVTWTVFRYLQQQSQLGTVLGMAHPRVLYWGAELPTKPISTSPDIEKSLREILLAIGDSPRSLSEPDIILVTDEAVCTIEVKYRADNSVQRDHPRFPEYLNAAPGLFKDAGDVAASGYYELTRNVVFTKLLAEKLNCRWKVINLGMPRILASAERFAEQLSDPSVFEIQTWPEVCRRIPQPSAAWFQSYLQQKVLE